MDVIVMSWLYLHDLVCEWLRVGGLQLTACLNGDRRDVRSCDQF